MEIIISEVRIQNFRSLKNVNVRLSPNITLLVGANNAGKTTFLRALNIALNLDRKFITIDDLFIDHNGEQLPKEERVVTIDIKIIPANDLRSFDDDWVFDFEQDIKADKEGGDMFAFRTKIDFTNNIQSSKIQRYVINDWNSGVADESDSGIIKANLENIPFFFIDAQRDLFEETTQRTSDFGRLAGKVEYDDEKRKELEKLLEILNNEAVENSDILNNLKQSLDNLNKTVHTKGNGIEITPFPKKVRDLSKGMKVHFQDGESDSFSLEYHGMGTRSWASLLTFKAMIEQEAKEKNNDGKPFHPSLGLEEPEAHLHPNAQRQVYQQLSSIKGQKIVSTHSPYIVSQADLSELRHFSKTTDETIVNFIDTQMLDTDGHRRIIREVLPTGDLLFSRAIVLFEGETEAQALPIFAKKYWANEPFEINFISVKGNGYKPFLIFANSMQIPWFIFSDYDKPSIKTGIHNAMKEIGFDCLIEYSNIIKLEKSIENYLIGEGYQNEIKAGINQYFNTTITDDTDKRQIEAGQFRIKNYKDEELLKDISSDNGKVRYPAYWANEIISRDDEKSIPLKVRELFDAIDKELKR